MEDWEHPYGIQGIPYIATGMNLFMHNDSRINNLSIRYGFNYKEIVENAINLWEQKKKRWEKNAEQSPTLFKYLKDKYYM
jgi:hypothetical protein